MHQDYILVIGADLRRLPLQDRSCPEAKVHAGPETERVCKKAAELASIRPRALVYATAGHSPRYKVLMGRGPMKQALSNYGVALERIETPDAATFDTDGEVLAFAGALPFLKEPDLMFTTYLVCRWWHLPRAWLLLRARLEVAERARTTIVPVPVWTFADPVGMLREPLAWVKNARRIKKAFS